MAGKSGQRYLTRKVSAQPMGSLGRSGLLQRTYTSGGAASLTGKEVSASRPFSGQRSATPVEGTTAMSPNAAGQRATVGGYRFKDLAIQAKLTIGQPNDKYEQEADRVADQVMRMPEPQVQRVCPKCEDDLQRQPIEPEEEEEETLQAKAIANQITPLIQRQAEPEEEEEEEEEELLQPKLASVIQRQAEPGEEKEEEEELLQPKAHSGRSSAISSDIQDRLTTLRGRGQPLSQSERAFFEPRLGTDLGQVRVHANGEAAQLNRELNAQAFTHGRDVFFGAGKYRPESGEGKRLLAHELTHVIQQRAVAQRQPPQPSHSTAILQRQPAAPAAPAPALTLTPTDQLYSASLLDTLNQFQNIPIDVPGFQPLPPGLQGPPTPITVQVNVHAQYFINTATARAHFRAARRTQRFRSIIRALARRGQMSVLRGSRGPRSAGRAVEYGKASPSDIKNFVEEAIRQDIIRRYAIRRRAITARQQLTDLAPAVLQALIQRWMRHTGVGVDCSGFVQQAMIRAREAERRMTSIANSIRGVFGLPPVPLPPAISPVERSAASFTRGARVRRPTDLRPGDAWVVRGGGHVRIVTNVRQVTPAGGSTTIEFDTAESSGGSTQPSPGPVARTWRTHSLTRFHRITAVRHTARSRGGTFHRI
jgi:cell wall-associated NlpC family hydrolase